MNKTSWVSLVLVGLVLAFTLGYKMGDSRGYADGYNEGYRYDCKEEIGLLYKQVKSQSKALDYTDSTIKMVMRLNDSLRSKEEFQRIAEERLERERVDSINRAKYSKYAARYSDSVNNEVGGYVSNFVMADGRVNLLVCGVKPYNTLKECECWNNAKKDGLESYSQAMARCQEYARNRFSSGKKVKGKK